MPLRRRLRVAWLNKQVKRKLYCRFVVSECDCWAREQAKRPDKRLVIDVGLRVCAWQSTKAGAPGPPTTWL